MGSVSGGCVEGAAAEEIERARRTGRARVIRYGISDEEAWDVGLACGAIDVSSAVGRAAGRWRPVRSGRRRSVTPLPADARRVRGIRAGQPPALISSGRRASERSATRRRR
jgi:xanthine/CO dehydrogenase XdhC/CoxF family maturation factor